MLQWRCQEVSDSMLSEYLIETYGYNEPIFLKNLTMKGMNSKALRQAVNRLANDGKLLKYDAGIYYIPKPDRLLKRAALDSNKVIVRKYITNGRDIYGYYAGLAAANRLGFTTQMPAQIELTTNMESSRGRTVVIGTRTVRVKRPKAEITADNYLVLQLLEILQDIETISDLEQDKLITSLKNYITSNQLDWSQVMEYIFLYPGKVAQKIIKWGLTYDFTQQY